MRITKIATYLPLEGSPNAPQSQATPAREQPNDDHCKYDSTHRLQLSFDEKPKDPAKGYSFGTDSQRCDVLLGSRGAHQISGLHFSITFDDTIDDETHLILRDSSTNGTAVSYSDQAKEEVRHHFAWILDLEKEEGKWKIEVYTRGLSFKVELASHKTCKAEYDKNVEDFLQKTRSDLPPLDILGINSHTTTAQPSQPLTPRQLPIYIRERKLGSGSFGGVDKVIDVSTGAIYARKAFYEPQWGKGRERRMQQKEDWLNRVRREIRIMRENPHVSIITHMDWMESDRHKGKYRSGRGFPRGPCALSGDAILSSRKSGGSAQRKPHCCGRNHRIFFPGSQHAPIPTSAWRGTSRLEAGEYPG